MSSSNITEHSELTYNFPNFLIGQLSYNVTIKIAIEILSIWMLNP